MRGRLRASREEQVGRDGWCAGVAEWSRGPQHLQAWESELGTEKTSRFSRFKSLRITCFPQQYIRASASSSIILAVRCSSEVPPFRSSLSSFPLPPRPGERQTQNQVDPSLVREIVEKQDVGRLPISLRSWCSSPSFST
ncbi:unnamed protein product [Rangifer tarandus platyrhynchus]|uniref:Uncharacterized protein n=1 Tax=Rangifer tarandus platyrhynchus TaxID=3082113 RepID=A0AC59YF06_RANTA